MDLSTQLKREYFEWICDLVMEDSRPDFFKLLKTLHSIPFTSIIEMDKNREQDGYSLRYKFAYRMGHDPCYVMAHTCDDRCTVLEIMISLAFRCENIMADLDYGDRTAQWFWEMISNLGLGSMTDNRFDLERVEYVINRFLKREYEPDGKGGLFYLRKPNPKYDLRDVELGMQMTWYLDEAM